MAEAFEDEAGTDRPGDATAQFMRRELSQSLRQAISRRIDTSKSVTPRIGGKVEVCGVVYEKSLQEELPSGLLDGDVQDAATDLQARTSSEKRKLVIILVGLPGRGKTYLCNKLTRYLNWLGHMSKHFNVGKYRRELKGSDGDEQQNHHFFDHNNEAGMRLRQQALNNALDALMSWLQESSEHQVAIFDATNTTEERRNYLIQRFHGRVQYLFIESICNDAETIKRNTELKLKYSPDYTDMENKKAVRDFEARIREYEKVYQPLTDGKSNRHIHFIQLVNMVTGRGHMDINRISGYIPGKIVFFLMQVCRSGLSSNRRIWLTRHGESEYNRRGLVGGDAPLTDKGRMYATALARALCTLVPMPESDQEDELLPVSCWTSTLQRTIQTAKHIPFPKLRWKALDEIQAGICDGYSYEGIREKWPETYAARKADKLHFRYPAGESYMDVIKRLESTIIEVERENESICIIGHQAILRCVYAYFMKIPSHEMTELSMPLHTLIELEPRPDGTMAERRFKINIESTGDDDIFESITHHAAPPSPGSQPVPKPYDALVVAAETAEDEAGMINHASVHSATPSLSRVKFGSVVKLTELDRKSKSDDEEMGSISHRADSVASCASEWVNQRDVLPQESGVAPSLSSLEEHALA